MGIWRFVSVVFRLLGIELYSVELLKHSTLLVGHAYNAKFIGALTNIFKSFEVGLVQPEQAAIWKAKAKIYRP